MKTNIHNHYSEILKDKSFRLTAERLTIQAGVRADLKGYERLVDAVILFGTDTCTNFGEIYEILGELNGIKPKSVMREITYAVMQAFEISLRLSRMIGTPIKPSDVHSSLVIAFLGKLFKNPDLSVYA